jgi:mannose-6-phosphate isomerase
MGDLPPLTLERRLDSRLWGGSSLQAYLGLPAAPERLAEVWLVYEENRVQGGPFAGETLKAVARSQGEALLGRRVARRFGGEFPLLAKLIDAADRLSVQVHPDDDYAHTHEAATGFHGKNEAWHILRAREGAELFHGFARDVDRDEVRRALERGAVVDLLRRVPAVEGDTVLVEAGTIHAINEGVMLFEIQQKSDLTYRLYDYGRTDASGKPRPLHIDQALQVLRFQAAGPAHPVPRPLGPGRDLVAHCAHFAMERWSPSRAVDVETSPETFEILTVAKGSFDLRWTGGERWLKQGEAAVLPASLGRYQLRPEGAATLLRCLVP